MSIKCILRIWISNVCFLEFLPIIASGCGVMVYVCTCLACKRLFFFVFFFPSPLSAAVGLWGAVEGALHRPEGPSLLPRPLQVHELRPRLRYGELSKPATASCQRCAWQWIVVILWHWYFVVVWGLVMNCHFELGCYLCKNYFASSKSSFWVYNVVIGMQSWRLLPWFPSVRCGRVWMLWRLAEWCWVRPTPLTPSPAPSAETSASRLAGGYPLPSLLAWFSFLIQIVLYISGFRLGDFCNWASCLLTRHWMDCQTWKGKWVGACFLSQVFTMDYFMSLSYVLVLEL